MLAACTAFECDFQQTIVRSISEMTCWSVLSHRELGEQPAASSLLQKRYQYSVELEAAEPKIDYFATSLPAMLLFDEDLKSRSLIEARFLRAQGLAGLGRLEEAGQFLLNVLDKDRNHGGAADLLEQLGTVTAVEAAK